MHTKTAPTKKTFTCDHCERRFSRAKAEALIARNGGFSPCCGGLIVVEAVSR